MKEWMKEGRKEGVFEISLFSSNLFFLFQVQDAQMHYFKRYETYN